MRTDILYFQKLLAWYIDHIYDHKDAFLKKFFRTEKQYRIMDCCMSWQYIRISLRGEMDENVTNTISLKEFVAWVEDIEKQKDYLCHTEECKYCGK